MLETEVTYKLSEFEFIVPDDIKVLEQVAAALHGDDAYNIMRMAAEGGEEDGRFDEVFDLLGPCEGCVPEAYVEELERNVIRKVKGIYYAAVRLARIEMLNTGQVAEDNQYDLEVVVEPSVEDATTVVVIFGDFCLIDASFKVWNFEFETLSAIVAAVRVIRDRIVTRFMELAGKL